MKQSDSKRNNDSAVIITLFSCRNNVKMQNNIIKLSCNDKVITNRSIELQWSTRWYWYPFETTSLVSVCLLGIKFQRLRFVFMIFVFVSWWRRRCRATIDACFQRYLWLIPCPQRRVSLLRTSSCDWRSMFPVCRRRNRAFMVAHSPSVGSNCLVLANLTGVRGSTTSVEALALDAGLMVDGLRLNIVVVRENCWLYGGVEIGILLYLTDRRSIMAKYDCCERWQRVPIPKMDR